MTESIAETKSRAEQLGLPQPDQIGFVVRDLDSAIRLYEPLFGPFKITDYGDNVASYRGAPPSEYKLKFAFGRIGGIEIELIEWVEGDTPHREFIGNGREGVQHLRFRIEDFDAWEKKLNSIGYRTVWGARMSPEIAYAYFERPGDPLMLELLQYPATGDPSSAEH